MKNVLLFPTKNVTGYILTILEDMGNENVLPVLREDYAKKNKLVEEYIADDFTSFDNLIKKIETWARLNDARFTGIIGIDDEDQFETVRRIAQHFGLDYYDNKTLIIASNKFLMKQQFEKNKVPTGAFALISDSNDKQVNKIGFPNVLKILTGNGSEFLFFNRDTEELKRNLEYMHKNISKLKDDEEYSGWFRKISFKDTKKIIFDPTREFLLEEYLNGDEYSCDFLLYNGQIKILRVVKKFKAKYFGYFEAFYLMNNDSISYYGIDIEKLKRVCRKIAKSLLIDASKGSNICMVDFMMVNGEIKVIETNIRPGISSFLPLMKEVYEYTSFRILSNSKIGLNIDCTIPHDEGLAVYLYCNKTGKIRKFDTCKLEKLREELDIVDIIKSSTEGDVVSDTEVDHWGFICGTVHIRNPRREEIPSIIERIKESVDIVVEHE